MIVTMIVLSLILGGGTIWFLKPMPEIPDPVLRKFYYPIERAVNGIISPDGKMVVYRLGIFPDRTIWIQDMDQMALERSSRERAM